MITLIVPGPGGRHIRITTDTGDTAVNKVVITMILRQYRDNGCRI